MARRKRRKSSASPRRRRRSTTTRRRSAAPRRRKRLIAVLRPTGRTRRIYSNPRRRRSRRRNPSFRSGALVKNVFTSFASGFITSMAASVLDTGLAAYPMVRNVAKVAGAFAIAHFGRRHPQAASAAIGALAATQGYALGTKLAGGMIARTPSEAVKGLGDMADSYPEMGALLQGGMGSLMGVYDDETSAVNQYAQGLAGDDEDYA